MQPTSGTGKLLWHAHGAKTLRLIHDNVHVEEVRDDLDSLVLDADLLEAVMAADPKKKSREIEFKLTARLRNHLGKQRFKALSVRLDELKLRHEKGVLKSVEFLKALLALARDLVAAERDTPPEEDENRGKAALTELFEQVRNESTPVIVERVVTAIDEIVRVVRFPKTLAKDQQGVRTRNLTTSEPSRPPEPPRAQRRHMLVLD